MIEVAQSLGTIVEFLVATGVALSAADLERAVSRLARHFHAGVATTGTTLLNKHCAIVDPVSDSSVTPLLMAMVQAVGATEKICNHGVLKIRELLQRSTNKDVYAEFLQKRGVSRLVQCCSKFIALEDIAKESMSVLSSVANVLGKAAIDDFMRHGVAELCLDIAAQVPHPTAALCRQLMWCCITDDPILTLPACERHGAAGTARSSDWPSKAHCAARRH